MVIDDMDECLDRIYDLVLFEHLLEIAAETEASLVVTARNFDKYPRYRRSQSLSFSKVSMDAHNASRYIRQYVKERMKRMPIANWPLGKEVTQHISLRSDGN